MKTCIFLFGFLLVLISATALQATDYLLISELGSSASAIGIGNIEGFSESADNIFENPAGLARLQNHSISLFATTILDEVQYHKLAAATVTPFGTFGFGFLEATVSGLAQTAVQDSSQNINSPFYALSYFDYKNMVAKLAYQISPLPFLSLGTSLTRFSTSYFTVSGQGMDSDLGALLRFPNLDISLVIKDWIPQQSVSFSDGRTEGLPMYELIGADYHTDFGDLFGQIKYISDHLLWAGGLRAGLPFVSALQFSAGVKEAWIQGSTTTQKNISLGIALHIAPVDLHYAYEKSNNPAFDGKNYVSFALNF